MPGIRNDRSGGGRRAMLGAAAFTLALVGLLYGLAVGPDGWRDLGDQLASVTGAVVGLLGLMAASRSQRFQSQPPDPTSWLRGVAEDLAQTVRWQWQHEVGARGLNSPSRIRIGWATTTRPVTAHQTITEVSGRGPVGDFTTTAPTWRALDPKQLVIIGEPGAGKTTMALILLLDLLSDRRADDPVPVMLTLASWNPEQHLDTWLAGRLAEEYPRLGPRGSYGQDAALRLVDRGMILPILDGLDELPQPRRARVLAALNDAVGASRPVVLTCRAMEYQEAITTTGIPLGRARVVELNPVTGQGAADFLPSGQIDGPRRWEKVVTALREQPNGVLAQALTTPLMVDLARTVYTPPTTDPDELLSHPTAAKVEEHLLDSYVDCRFAPRTPARPEQRGRAREYSPERARAWLTYLAFAFKRYGNRDIEWENLKRLIPHHATVFSPIMGAVLGLGVTVVGGLAASPMVGLLAGVALGVATGSARISETLATRVRLATRNWRAMGPSDPRAALRRAQISVTVVASAVLLGSGLATGLLLFALHRSDLAFAAGTTIGLTSGLGVLVVSDWGGFWIARCWFGCRGMLPWRLFTFLEDASRRGVFRQVGSQWQFRHARIQDHLDLEYQRRGP